MAHMFQDGDLYLLVVDFFPQDCDEDSQFIDLDQAEMGGDSVSSVAAVREAQARQRAASRNDRRRCLNCWTVGAHNLGGELRVINSFTAVTKVSQ